MCVEEDVSGVSGEKKESMEHAGSYMKLTTTLRQGDEWTHGILLCVTHDIRSTIGRPGGHSGLWPS